jgi:D-alanyl-D-alanine carboxypeptidase (penicillin-binding protein 5/6)
MLIYLKGVRNSLLSLIVVLVSFTDGHALGIDAREYILMDMQTWTILAEKNSDQRMPPSSMSKLMTAYMVFEALDFKQLSLDDEFSVSDNAWRMGGAASGGSTMFLEPGKRVTVEDLLRGIIVQSGNDACIVVAENMSGSEELFALEMNERALKLGLKNSNFTNATGLPDPEHYTTPKDLALLARHIIMDFPEYYSLYGEKDYSFNGIKQYNRNPLLRVPGSSDGLKTGYTKVAGYGLTASAVRGDRRLVLVANGMKSTEARKQETARLMDWGFRNFINKTLFRAGEVVEYAEVWLGTETRVPLILDQDIVVAIPRQAWRSLEVKAVYEGPIAAPINLGDNIATLIIDGEKMEPIEYQLQAGGSVQKLGILARAVSAVSQILFGYSEEIG